MARMPAETCRPSTTPAAARRSSMREFVQEPMKTVSTAISRIGVPARQPHVGEGPAGRLGLAGSVEGVGVGHRAVDRRRPGTGSCPTTRAGAAWLASIATSLSNVAPVVGGQAAPVLERRSHAGALRARGRRPSQPGEGGVVGGDHAGPGAGLDRHVADRHPALHRKRPDGRAPVLDDVADAAAGADAADEGEDDVLGGDAGGQVARRW